jgi:phasin family protein
MSRKSSAADATKAYEAAVVAGKEQMEGIMKATGEATEKAIAAGRERLEKAFQGLDSVAEFNKQSFEAVVEAGKIAAKGFEAVNAETLAFTKAQLDESVQAARALAGARTLQALIDAQTSFAKGAFEAYLAQTTKVGEMTAKVAQDAYAPINAQIQAAVEKFVKPLAA